MAEIRALTVRPPWSWAIADLGKDVEKAVRAQLEEAGHGQ